MANDSRGGREDRQSEIPRPSSRETATPPRWVSGRGGTVATRTVRAKRQSPDSSCRAGRGGPRPGVACRENRPDTRQGPRGDIASHFVGLLVFPCPPPPPLPPPPPPRSLALPLARGRAHSPTSRRSDPARYPHLVLVNL